MDTSKMTAAEMVEVIKSARRVELAEIERKKRERDERIAGYNKAHFESAIKDSLYPFDELAKCPRVISDIGMKHEKTYPIVTVDFDFPSCLTVVSLTLIGRDAGNGEMFWKEAVKFTDGEYPSWRVEGLDGGFDLLADALIAAEQPNS